MVVFEYPTLTDPLVVSQDYFTPERFVAVDPATDPIVKVLEALTIDETFDPEDLLPYVFWVSSRRRTWLTLSAALKFGHTPITTVYVFRNRFCPRLSAAALKTHLSVAHTAFALSLLRQRDQKVTLVSLDDDYCVTFETSLMVNTLLYQYSYVRKATGLPREDRLSFPCYGSFNILIHALLSACFDMIHTADPSRLLSLVEKHGFTPLVHTLKCIDYLHDQFTFPQTVTGDLQTLCSEYAPPVAASHWRVPTSDSPCCDDQEPTVATAAES
jgi:hypothetical protein